MQKNETQNDRRSPVNGKRPLFFSPSASALCSGFIETVLASLAGFLAALFTGMFALDLTAPLRTSGDYVFALFHIKTLLRHGVVHANPDMAFPGTGHFEAFPLPDLIGHALTRFFSILTGSPLALLPMVLCALFMGLGLSTYFALRTSGQSRLFAFIGGFLYASSAHMVEKAHIHPWLCVLLAVPWVCRLILLTPYQKASLGRRPLVLSVLGAFIVGLASGAAGIYTAFFSALYLAAGLLLFALFGLTQQRLKPLMAALGGTILSFGALAAPLMIKVIQRGERFPDRDLFFQPLYGLRLPDVFIPHLPVLTGFYDVFHKMQDTRSDEGNYAILGLWGVIALLGASFLICRRLLPARSVPRLTRREPMIRIGLFMIFLGILFAVPYGLGFVFNQLVNGAIRSQVRIGSFFLPFTLFFAPALFVSLQKKTALRRDVFAILLVGLALLTNLPFFQKVARGQQTILPVWEERKTSVLNSLQSMDRYGLRHIAQYPSIYMPEGPATPAFGNIDYLWPYIMDPASDRKWSFGSMVFESTWSRIASVMRDQPDVWRRELILMGFDAILFEKDAMYDPDRRAVESLRSTNMAGDIVYEDKARLVLRLTPPSLQRDKK